jgi:hypothetical protein
MVPAFRHVLIPSSWGSADLRSQPPSLSDFRGGTRKRVDAGEKPCRVGRDGIKRRDSVRTFLMKTALARKWLLLMPIAFLSFGCSPESPAWHAATSKEDKDEYFRSRCLSYGFDQNSPELNQCIRLWTR